MSLEIRDQEDTEFRNISVGGLFRRNGEIWFKIRPCPKYHDVSAVSLETGLAKHIMDGEQVLRVFGTLTIDGDT